MTTAPASLARTVRSGAVSLAVREHGEPGASGPHLVLVHGFPDDQSLWDRVVPLLTGAGLRVVTYDVRGAGASTRPRGRSAYRMERLAEDLLAVLDGTVPAGEQAHLVGHDWGAIQLWGVLAGEDPARAARLRRRVASFTSVSGTHLDHVGLAVRRPRGRVRALLAQLRSSTYVLAFQLPLLPELVWRGRTPFTGRAMGLLSGQGHDRTWSPAFGATAATGVNLYRANVLPRLLRPRRGRITVPVLVVGCAQDAFVGPTYLDGLDEHCTGPYRRVTLDAPHWSPCTHPAGLAELVLDAVAAA